MKMYLTLSDARPVDLSKTWLKPKALRAHLASPSLNTSERIKAVSEAVSNLAHAEMHHDTRMDYLNQYRVAISGLKPELENQLVGLVLPPNSDDLSFCDQCSELYRNLAVVCKRIILTAPEDIKWRAEDQQRVLQACYWGILFLGERLRYAYCSYRHAPAETWLEIHQIYQYSRSKHIAKSLLKGEKSKLRNISHAYKRMLLFGVCDPYQFPFRTVHGVYNALDDWAKLASLRSGKPTKDTCLFLINPESDRPAMPMLPKLSVGVDTLYLDTSALVSVLNWDLDSTHRDLGLREKTNEGVRKTLETKELLKNLIISWGIYSSRELKRKQTDGHCDVGFGITSVAALTNPNQEAGGNGLYVRSGLQLVDESPTGARIRLKENDHTHIRVGELIALKRSQIDNWSIGMVRWAQTDIDSRFYIGMYKFVDNGVRVFISPARVEDETSPGSGVGIWSIRKRANEQIPTLIIDPRFYTPNETIQLERGDVRLYLEMGKVILSTRYFIWLEVNLFNSTPRRSAGIVAPLFELAN